VGELAEVTFHRLLGDTKKTWTASMAAIIITTKVRRGELIFLSGFPAGIQPSVTARN